MNTQVETTSILEKLIVVERAVLYARVSYDDRDTDGRNLKGQLDMGREFAHTKGFKVVDELAEDDKGASGADFDLPKLNQALEMAKAGEFEVLIVRELDRLSRSLAKQLIIEKMFQDAGVKVEYVLGEYADTPEGILNKQIKGVIAEYEREKIRERMMRGRRLKVKAGNVIAHGKTPYGYRLNDEHTKFVIYEPEAKIVAFIFEWYTVDCLSTAQICDRLNSMGVPPPAAADLYYIPGQKQKPGEKQWYNGNVHNILRNETYYGVWRYGKDNKETMVETNVPPIINAQIFQLAKERREQRRTDWGRIAKNEYLLARRCVCHCGASISGLTTKRNNRIYSYYRCIATIGGTLHQCDLPYFKVKDVDETVWEWVKERMSSIEAVSELLAMEQGEREKLIAPFRERIQLVESLLSENRRQMEKLLDLYLNSDFPKEMLTERKQTLERTIKSLENEHRKLLTYIEGQTLKTETIDEVLKMQAKIVQRLSNAEDFPTKREVIELLDLHVRLHVEDGMGVAYVTCILGTKRLGILSSQIH